MLFSLRRDKRTIMTSILALPFSKLYPESNAHNAEQIVVLSGTYVQNPGFFPCNFEQLYFQFRTLNRIIIKNKEINGLTAVYLLGV
jgi:hypothetical protein